MASSRTFLNNSQGWFSGDRCFWEAPWAESRNLLNSYYVHMHAFRFTEHVWNTTQAAAKSWPPLKMETRVYRDNGSRNFSILLNIFMYTGCTYVSRLPSFICNIKPVSWASKHLRLLDSVNGEVAFGVESEEPTDCLVAGGVSSRSMGSSEDRLSIRQKRQEVPNHSLPPSSFPVLSLPLTTE